MEIHDCFIRPRSGAQPQDGEFEAVNQEGLVVCFGKLTMTLVINDHTMNSRYTPEFTPTAIPDSKA